MPRITLRTALNSHRICSQLSRKTQMFACMAVINSMVYSFFSLISLSLSLSLCYPVFCHLFLVFSWVLLFIWVVRDFPVFRVLIAGRLLHFTPITECSLYFQIIFKFFAIHAAVEKNNCIAQISNNNLMQIFFHTRLRRVLIHSTKDSIRLLLKLSGVEYSAPFVRSVCYCLYAERGIRHSTLVCRSS